MARMRSTLVAATATIAALAAPTTASAVTVTNCDELQNALDTQSVVTLAEGLTCHGGFDLPSAPILLEGGGAGATLSGDLGKGGRTQILSGVSVGATTIRNLTFIDGQADETNGGAIGIEGDSPVTIEDNDFLDNEAVGGGSGGAVALELDNQNVAARTARGASPPIVLRGNTFGGPEDGNRADNRGGAVLIDAAFRSVTLDDNVFEDNQSGDDGGGAAITACTAEITANVFDGNVVENFDTSLDGGGLFLEGFGCGNLEARGGSATDVTQEDNLFVDNKIRGEFSNARGGGEFVEGLTVLSTSDSFVGNSIVGTSSGFGGGLSYGDASNTGDQAPLAARNLVVTGNVVDPAQQSQQPSRGVSTVPGFGGGLFLAGSGADFRVEDSTVEGNSAPTGPGIASFPSLQADLRGGPVSSGLVLHNSIVYGNPGPDGGADLFGFASRDVRSSDVCDGTAAHADGDGTEPNSNRCVEPVLAGVNKDGDVDQLAGSPTIDAGDATLVDADLASDYTGDARVLNGKVDMGADEYEPATVEEPAVTPPAAQPAPQGAVQGQTQRSCVSRRSFTIRIRVPRGRTARSAVVRVNNKKVKVVRGKRLRAPVRLRGLPKGKFTVRITVRLTNGKRITGKRTYHTCIPKLPGDGPPKL